MKNILKNNLSIKNSRQKKNSEPLPSTNLSMVLKSSKNLKN